MKMTIGKTIREIRISRGLSQIELSRKTGVDPRTITAIEKGRIVNPSLEKLKKIAAGLQITLRDLFGRFEGNAVESFFLGSQRGEFQIDYPKYGFRIVSYLPKETPLFAGKIVLESRSALSNEMIKFQGKVFLQIILGRLNFTLEGVETLLKEGQNVMFDGRLSFTLANPLLRETSALLVAVPSFLTR